jgi:tetratricopeptide (TPR) repeat protein
MKRKFLIPLVFLLIVSGLAVGQEALAPSGDGRTVDEREDSPFLALQASPALVMPLGGSADYFKPGLSARFGAEYSLILRPVVYLGAGIAYELSPVKAEESLSILSAGVGSGAYMDISPRFGIKSFVDGGYYYSFFNTIGETAGGGNPYVNVGLGAYFLLSPVFNLGVDISYRNYFALNQGLAVTFDTTVYLSGRENRESKIERAQTAKFDLLQAQAPATGEGIEVGIMNFEPIFPVFYSYYDDHPVGRVLIRSLEEKPITDIKISFLVRQYMDAPKECLVLDELPAEQSREVDLFALFTEKVLEITEGTKVAAELILEYRMKNRIYRDTKVITVEMYDRNAMTWDDDRKAAAFVTAKEPGVLSFSKNVMGVFRDTDSFAFNENLLKAMAVHEALSLYGVSYVRDPKTPYDQLSQNSTQVDYLQFPRHTLEYKAGDCDDLSILYCALLECISVDTAFITIPGHIYMAFALSMTQDEARHSFFKPDDLVFREGKVWIPLEITDRRGGFLKAWQTGAKEWRDNVLLDQAGFYPVAEAWKTYHPVGLPGIGGELAIPPMDMIESAYDRELAKLVEQAIYPQVLALEEELRKTNDTPRVRNKLGVLYARHGQWDSAEQQFLKILAGGDYLPALYNLGNLYFLREEWQKALAQFQKAAKLSPGDEKIRIALARVYHELGNYGMAQNLYDQAKETDPQLAEKYAYLELRSRDTRRAAEADRSKGGMIWFDD